ncbi:MAG TPA: hypothetical protein PKE52_01675, partial [Bacteroidales bacterium]|nr:hypothetical protein [Bacteroidales bacterium]
TATGGSGETVVWYTGYCGSSQIVGTNSPLTIQAPSSTTNYFAQWTNGCGASTCANVQVVVNPKPVASFS